MEKWSRPIFDEYRERDERLPEKQKEELAAARQRRQLREAKSAAAQGLTSSGLPHCLGNRVLAEGGVECILPAIQP